MGRPCSKMSLLTREFLYDAYCVQKLGVLQIARQIGCRNGTICNLLDQYELRETITKEWLIEHYVTNQESIDEIAALWKIDEASVRHHLRRHSIPIRYKSRGRIQIDELNDYQWLYHHYVELDLSSCQIAELLHCSQAGVIYAVQKAGIPTRPRVASRSSKPKGYVTRFSHRKRRLIKERDDYTCQMPGCGKSTNLEIHHIVPIHERGINDLDNGITLCSSCHDKTLQHEDDYELLFKTIIASKSGAAHLVSTPLQLRLFT